MIQLGRLAAVSVLAGGIGLVGAADAHAQTCLGVPAGGGQFAVNAGIDLADGQTNYGVGGQANLEGPLSVGARYARTSFEVGGQGGNVFGANAAYEFSTRGFSICPVTGIDFTGFSVSMSAAEIDNSIIVVPVGFAVGKRFLAGSSLSVMPFVMPQYQYIRMSSDFLSGAATSSVLGAELGVSLDARPVYGSASVQFTTVENSDPSFSIGVGAVVP